MKTFFRVFSYARKLNLFVPQYIIFTLLSVVFNAFNMALLIPLLDVLFEKNMSEASSGAGTDNTSELLAAEPPEFELTINWIIDFFNYHFLNVIEDHGKVKALLLVCLVIMASVFLTNLFRYLAAIINAKVRLDVIKYLRMHIYNCVTGMHIGYFSNERKGDLMSRITNDVQEVETSVVNSPKALFREPIQIIVFFVALFNISYQLTFFTLLILPLTGIALGTLVKKLKGTAKASQESLGRIVNILDETLGGIRIIKAFNARGYVTDKIEQETDFYKKTNLSYSLRRELGSPISEFLGIGILSIILYYGGSLVLNNESTLSGSQFIAYLAIFAQVISPAKAFSNGLSNVQKGLASAERIFKVIDTEPEIIDKADASKLNDFNDQLEFNNVRFAYDSNEVLKGINFIVDKGKTVALVGPSGGGKSTIVDLIPRFYDPKQGQVLIDGKPLNEYQVESIRQYMGIVTQESILFNDTIFNNIAFGIPNARKADVIEAAKVANAHDFIMGFENGYETSIGDGGSKLSGGQRQRLSIARAVMKNPSILLLDEATSALDSESEKLVQEALANLMKNRTSVVIAHRLSTIQHADEILVVQEGEIIERGSHNELIAADGLYKKLSAMQNT